MLSIKMITRLCTIRWYIFQNINMSLNFVWGGIRIKNFKKVIYNSRFSLKNDPIESKKKKIIYNFFISIHRIYYHTKSVKISGWNLNQFFIYNQKSEKMLHRRNEKWIVFYKVSQYKFFVTKIWITQKLLKITT